MEKIQVINLEPCHSRISKYSILSVFLFLSLIKAQRIRLNNWKTMNNNETWWKKVKTNETNMTNTTKTMKHTEKKIHAMEGFQIHIYIYNLEQCHARVSKYSILSFFVFLSLIKAQRIRLNNWKALKKQWNMMKKRKNR